MTERRQSLHLFNFYLPFLGKYKELLIHEGGGSRHGPKIHFSFPVISRSFFIENTMEENQKMGPRNLPKNVHIEARADVERPISHFVFIGLLPFPFFLTTPELLAIKIVCL